MEWHRIFGLMLMDFFAGSPYEVELEKDLSLKLQLLDVIVVRRRPGEFSGILPDGLEDLAEHNLMTFKSHHDALDDWTLKELTGHYVNYRKQVSPTMQDLLPETAFRLYGVCMRFPQNLAAENRLEEVRPGIYDCRRGTDRIRIIVTRQLAQEERNALFHLFSAVRPTVQYGAEHYRWRTGDTSSLVNRLFQAYRLEGWNMPYTMQDFRRDFVKEHLSDLTPEERLAGLPPEERVKGLPPEERLKGLTAEEIESYLKTLKARDQEPPGN